MTFHFSTMVGMTDNVKGIAAVAELELQNFKLRTNEQ